LASAEPKRFAYCPDPPDARRRIAQVYGESL